MQRKLALAGLIVLLVLGAVVLFPSGEPTREERGDPTRPETWTGAGTEGVNDGAAPTLRGSTREGGTGTKDAARGESEAAPKERTGPYEFSAVAAESEAPLDEVAITPFGTEDALGTTDEDGYLLIEDAGVSKLEVRATKDGFVTYKGTARPGEVTRIVLEPGVAIAGTVIDGRTRKPVANASLVVWDEDYGSEVAAVGTDEEGRFRIRAVRPHHPVQIVVVADGLVPYVHSEIFFVEVKDLEIRIGEGGRLTGRVLTPEEKPLADTEVRLLPQGGPIAEIDMGGDRRARAEARLRATRTSVTRTNEKGVYEFVGVPLRQVMVPAAVLNPRRVIDARNGAWFSDLGETREIDIEVDKAASLRIRLQEEDGTPVGAVETHILADGGQWPIKPGDAHAEGGYLLTDVAPVSVVVMASLPGAPAQRARTRLKPGEEGEVVLTFPRGKRIHGTVLDKRGAPLWKARVGWRGDDHRERVDVRADEKGRFTLRRLTSNTGTLYVSARDLLWTRKAYEGQELQHLAPADTPLEIRLLDGTRAFGRFDDLPVGTRVTSELARGSEHDVADHQVKDDRRFDRRGPRPNKNGATIFVFRTRGYPPLLVEERRPFTSEEARDLGPLRFEATNPRMGRVVDEKKRPVHGAKITIKEAWSNRSTRSDTEGDFAFPRMPDLRVHLEIEAEGFPTTPAVLQTTSQFHRQFILVQRAQQIHVQMQTHNGGDPGMVMLQVRAKPAKRARRDPRPIDRTYRVPSRLQGKRLHLPPGHYELRAYAPERKLFGTETIEVRTGNLRHVTITMAKAR